MKMSAETELPDLELCNQPVEKHLPVSGLIQNIVRDLGVQTVGDLCRLDINTVEQLKGVGVKKVSEFKRLIEMAQRLAGMSIAPVSHPQVEPKRAVFEGASLLVYVPSILKVAFEQIAIDTVEKLLALNIADLDSLPGWGEKRKSAVAGIKELYSRLATMPPDSDIQFLSDIVPKEVLPTESIGRMLIDKFMTGQYKESLRGKALQEANDLRMLLTRIAISDSTIDVVDDMDWRNIPLQIGVKVESIADQYKLKTIRQLHDFAIYGRILDLATGELIDVNRINNFGDASLADLREELHRLRHFGLKTYREQLGIAFDGDSSAEKNMEWRRVPLQVGVKVEAVADRYGLITIGQLVDFAMHGRVVDPATQELVDVLRAGNFGEYSLTALREELTRFDSMGLKAYRQQIGCDFSNPEAREMVWSDIPLHIGKRIQDFLRSQGIATIAEVQEVALRKQVFSKANNEWVSISEFENFSERSIHELRDELTRLDCEGLEFYRFGNAGAPKTLRECVDRALCKLQKRQVDILKARFSGATLEQVAKAFSLTRERVRQIASSAYKDLFVYRASARALYSLHEKSLPKSLYWDSEQVLSGLELDQVWHVDFLFELLELPHERLSPSTICRVPAVCVDALKDSLRKLLKADSTFSIRKISTIGDLLINCETAITANPVSSNSLAEFADCELTINDLHVILGEDWLRASIRSQIIDAGVNGIPFHEIDSAGAFVDPSILENFLGDDAVRLNGDIFRRSGEVYDRAQEVLDIIRAADGQIDAEYIIHRSKRKWHQAPLVGNYLSRLYEVVSTGRGVYLHIDMLGLSVEDVKKIAKWGADLLAGENRSIDGNELLDLYQTVDLPQKIENAHQLVSILAKHPDIRRLSNNLQLAHRNSFDVTELSLAKADPEIAAQWHPTKNGSVTPDEVRPNSFKKRWWKCDKGHEFEAMPVYRTRMIRSCPGCQERWNLAKVRHFVASLRPHLDALTPAELYVIFQQSGLLSHGGQSRGFVKALATGRFPHIELDKFIDGRESLVDDFINEQSMALDSPTIGDTLDDVEGGGSVEDLTTRKEAEDKSVKLPTVSTKKAIAALDCPAIASTDVEAVDFLIASAKAKVWSHAFRDPIRALQEIEHAGATEYSQRVRDEFLAEFNEASELVIPPGYTFELGGNVVQPNLMQRHVAFEIFKRKRFGNWSGTGAGKTLSAVLASRVCDSNLTVVWCPNAVVGDFKSGWSGEIGRMFADSDIAVKTWIPEWQQGSRHRYLVMNYEQLQQPNSESELKRFLENNNIDFIVIDEVHYAKQRYVDQLSQRKRLLQAMVSEAGRKNTELRVLGLSATPVINNLQEGRSLIEMITGVEHNDLPTKPTVPNCMRLHQQLARLGTRWRPEYEPSLIVETPEVNCEAWIDEIRDLGRNASPLDIEKILTRARIPQILEGLKRPGRSLIYTHYVDEIAATLYDTIAEAGFRVGFCTGDSKQGLEQFKSGEIDVLIGSSSIGTGVDGLQLVCDRLIINCLPWTNAEYEQLIGRLWRQGQTSKKVEVIVPLTYAEVNGVKWSYCHSKLQRIRYKKSIADAAVDGAVPEGNLRSPAQAQSDILAWLERLESGEELTIQRRPIVVPLSDVGAAAEKRLARYGDFSTMNARWNNSTSSKTSERLRTTPEEWEQYHTLYRKARENWSVVPFQEFIRWCKSREGYVIADFGCGEALVAKTISDRHTVHSFDHVAIDESVIEGDMAKTNLDPESVDVALFSLSLMGSNFTDYVREAYRVLKIDGQLHIWEAVSRFDDVKRFAKSLEQLGFQVFEPRVKGAFVLIEGRKTERQADTTMELRFREP
jgi:superfamily II DNA or RNA helicase